MNVDSTESWASQPDVCRLCLSTSGTWDVTASYITEVGNKEVYSELLQDCFGISLSHLTEWGPSRMACAVCVSQLRDAYSFRKQVEQAERLFVTYCDSRKVSDIFNPLTIKTELEVGDNLDSPNCVNNEAEDSDDDNKQILQPEAATENQISEMHKKKSQKTILKTKRKRKKMILKEDMDSDTPIAEFSKKNVPKEVVYKNENEIAGSLLEEASKDLNTAVVEIGFRHTRPQNLVKQVSERKRVILTCDTVLRDTTACPFRHHKSWFQCFFCQQDFMEINLLREHMLKTHADIDVEIKKIKRYPRSLQIEISNLECRQCHLNLTDVVSMCRHFVEVHKKVIYNECIADYKVDTSPYSCHICGQQFHVFRTLTTHLNEHYANCICDVCGKSFLNSKRLKVHKRTHENGHFPCSECGKILKTKTSKANHMESAHSKRVIKCQICFKPMKHYNDRIKHMSEVHNITHKFKCPICGREYNIKHYLATHIRQTHGQKNKNCSECGMAFITNHGLKKHMLKHSGLKPYSCNVCCKSYARSYTLREHMRAHDSEKRFADNE
ncbi:zinc finger protein 37 homolog [Helicoverpa zea]|uniref:zinc finger protein 37 homolog n=1 Tax=Helicoverpa zea TaxID=7113 RepID=UPI001F55C99E|nr:zinc finger protein 37 homolog [Helicoverpa zea]